MELLFRTICTRTLATIHKDEREEDTNMNMMRTRKVWTDAERRHERWPKPFLLVLGGLHPNS